MFEKEDIILYGVHGVCKITELVEREYGGVSKQYYVLKPMYNDNTSILYVPVDSQALVSKMKRVLSAEEIYALIRSMPKEQAIWIEDERERKARYKEILEHGERFELVGMIKALYQHQKDQEKRGRHLHVADERFFKTAEKILYDEFALVLEIEPQQVLLFVLQQIEVEKKMEA